LAPARASRYWLGLSRQEQLVEPSDLSYRAPRYDL
jgi:hypothetical protein